MTIMIFIVTTKKVFTHIISRTRIAPDERLMSKGLRELKNIRRSWEEALS